MLSHFSGRILLQNAASNQINSKMPKLVNTLKKKLQMEADKFLKLGVFPSTFKSDVHVPDSGLPSDSPYKQYISVPFGASTDSCSKLQGSN